MNTVTRLIVTLLFLAFTAGYSNAQDILLEEDVNADTTDSKKGPNKKRFSHNYYGLGFAVGPDNEGSKINYGQSYELTFGRRVKLRITNWYAVGFDLQYHLNQYSIKQNSTKILPNDSMHSTERLKMNQLGLGFYNRFNFGKRGNYIGNFIDVGVRLDVPFATSHVTIDKIDLTNNNNGRKVKIKTSNLRYIEDFSYSGYFRLGFNKFVLTASYRLADLFISDPKLYAKYNNGLTKYPELPLLNVGLEVGLH